MGKNKQWKARGEEDKFVENLISKGKITKDTNAAALMKTYPKTFSGFTANVVRNHLNILKRSKGLYCKCAI